MFQDDQTALQESQGRDLIDSAGGIWAEHLGAPACSRPRSSPPQPLNREETRSGAMIDPGYMSLDANMILIADSLISESVQPTCFTTRIVRTRGSELLDRKLGWESLSCFRGITMVEMNFAPFLS